MALTVSSPVDFTISPLRISTTTVTANWGMRINLNVLFEQLKAHFIPIGYPGEGILKFEHGKEVYGACYKDLFTNRKMTPKSFYNQSTLVLEATGWFGMEGGQHETLWFRRDSDDRCLVQGFRCRGSPMAP